MDVTDQYTVTKKYGYASTAFVTNVWTAITEVAQLFATIMPAHHLEIVDDAYAADNTSMNGRMKAVICKTWKYTIGSTIDKNEYFRIKTILHNIRFDLHRFETDHKWFVTNVTLNSEQTLALKTLLSNHPEWRLTLHSTGYAFLPPFLPSDMVHILCAAKDRSATGAICRCDILRHDEPLPKEVVDFLSKNGYVTQECVPEILLNEP